MRQKECVHNLLMDRYGTEPEFLWEKYPDFAVFRHPVSKKWYAMTMVLPRKTFQMEGEGTVEALNLKCSPALVGSLLAEKGFYPAYHMNKSTWISALLDESIPDETIVSLLELSYASVTPQKKKR